MKITRIIVFPIIALLLALAACASPATTPTITTSPQPTTQTPAPAQVTTSEPTILPIPEIAFENAILHEDYEHGYYISYPKEWYEMIPDGSNGIYTVGALNSNPGFPGVFIYLTTIKEGETSAEAGFEFLDSTGKNNPDFKVISQQELTLADGTPAYKAVCTISHTSSDDEKMDNVFIVRGTECFRLLGYSSGTTYDKDEPFLNETIQSFRLTTPSIKKDVFTHNFNDIYLAFLPDTGKTSSEEISSSPMTVFPASEAGIQIVMATSANVDPAIKMTFKVFDAEGKSFFESSSKATLMPSQKYGESLPMELLKGQGQYQIRFHANNDLVRVINFTITAPPTPRLEEPDLYKGFFEPAAYNAEPTVYNELDNLKELGANTFALGPYYMPSDDGSFYGMYPSNDLLLIKEIQAVHAKGLRVQLVLQFWSSYQKPDRSKTDSYLKEAEPLVLKWAEIAEHYNVEVFSPANEADIAFDLQKVSDWHQKLLPEIRERFSGVVRPSLAAAVDIDYRGFDYVSFNLVGARSSDNITGELAKALGYAQRDGCRGVFIGEIGVVPGSGAMGEGVSEEVQAEKIDLVFQETWGKVKGYSIVGWLSDEYYIKGRPAEQIVKNWYTK